MLGLRTFLSIGLLLAAGSASAGESLVSPADFSGMIDLRASAADGERSWLEGGLGKTRVSGGGNHAAVHARLGQSLLSWNPHLTWELSATVIGQYQPEHDRGPALSQAFLTYKPTPHSDTRFSARFGLLYPQISLEHTGPAWTDPDMITPSAINSWVGEEVKVVAAEATVRRAFGDQAISATIAVFGYNDTSGTLLTTRGWALGDMTAGAPDRFNLPPLGPFMSQVQAPVTNPVFEIDHHAGGYGRLEWDIGGSFSVNAFVYDNNGNLTGFSDGQWAWRTRFVNMGARLDIDSRTHLLAQAMSGDTRFGYAEPDIWVDTTFQAAYALIRRDFGPDALSARLDLFQTRDHTGLEYGDTREQGWALTADYRRRLSGHASLLVEVLHVASNRPARLDILGQAPRTGQTVAQAALRLSF